MALEVLSGSVYHDVAKQVAKPRVEMTAGQAANLNAISITEVQGIPKTTGSNQSGLDQNSSQKDAAASRQQIKDAVSKVNSKLKSHRTRCEFAYHEETKRVSIKVIDKETEEIIREIPPEQTLEMVEKMWELAGFLVDEKR